MISSYLIEIRFPQAVFNQDASHLLDLVGLGLPFLGLQIDDLCHVFPGGYVVIALDPLIEAQPVEKVTQASEIDVLIEAPARVLSRSLAYFPIRFHRLYHLPRSP